MAKIISICMNKGGVGKTSLITNLAAAISSRKPKKKVLIIDTDKQGNSAIAFGFKPLQFESTIYDVFLGEKSIEQVTVSIKDNLHLVPANRDMKFLDFDILLNIDKYNKKPFDLLKDAIDKVRNKYDYIFIDSPPYIGLVSGNVLNITDEVLIPFCPESFAVQGLIEAVEEIEDFKKRTNSKLRVAGIVGMMVDTRTSLHADMLPKARQFCLSKDYRMFETIIPRSIRFASATAYEGKPAVWTDSGNPIVSAYFELMDEVMEVG